MKINNQQPDVKVNSSSLGGGEHAESLDSDRKINSGYSDVANLMSIPLLILEGKGEEE